VDGLPLKEACGKILCILFIQSKPPLAKLLRRKPPGCSAPFLSTI
jgi:hypothetical protein